MNQQDKFRKTVKDIHRILMTIFLLIGIVSLLMVYIIIDPELSVFNPKELPEYTQVEEVDEDRIEDGIHVRTGLIAADGFMEVVNNCTNCHSAKLVIQNRMNAERWAATIDWMQETQNLWDLGKNEEIIINYLVKNYPPLRIGRRAPLSGVEWYELNK